MAKTADPGSEPPSELSLCRLCHAGEHAEAGCGSVKKELGLNAVRTSHYPQSHYFLERCDELGLLVFTEFPGWQHIGDDTWKAQAVVNAEDMIRQYRNHPSIICGVYGSMNPRMMIRFTKRPMPWHISWIP